MLFTVGVEQPKNKNEAWGLIVPIFEHFNLGCASAVDHEKDILAEARDAILSMAEIALENEYSLEDLARSRHDYSKQDDYQYYDRWLTIDVDMSALSDKT